MYRAITAASSREYRAVIKKRRRVRKLIESRTFMVLRLQYPALPVRVGLHGLNNTKCDYLGREVYTCNVLHVIHQDSSAPSPTSAIGLPLEREPRPESDLG